MAGHKKFRDLVKHIEADPVRRARADAYTRAIDDAVALGEVRERRGATQTALAGALGTSQANVSQIEGRHDLYLSTLREYVAALGGRLEVAAVFPDETIYITPPAELPSRDAPLHAER